MINQFTKFAIVNNSGQTLTFNNNGRINLKVTGWFITPGTGLVSYNVIADDDCGFIAASTLADGLEILSTVINNTAAKYLGYIVQLEITHDAGTLANGTFDVYELSGDASDELESDASGYDTAEVNKLSDLGSLTWPLAALDDELIRSPRIRVS